MSADISLPCASHRRCTYHKYFTASSPSDTTSGKTQAAIHTTSFSTSASSEDRRLSVQDTPSQLNDSTPILFLPTELILLLLPHLTIIDQASLSLTCRHFTALLGPTAWPQCSTAKGGSWRRQDDLLDVLQRDFDAEFLASHWRCTDCIQFHSRSKRPPKEPPKKGCIHRLLHLTHNLSRLLQPVLGNRNDSPLHLGPPQSPIYTLHPALISSIMTRHFLAAPRGTCLNALKCQGTHIFPLSPITNIHLRYTYTSKIVLDRLLLRATYTFRLQRTMFVNNVDLQEDGLEEFLGKMEFWICKHSQIRQVLQKEKGQPVPESRCKYCPTLWHITFSTPHEHSISVYHNTGSGSLTPTRFHGPPSPSSYSPTSNPPWPYLSQPLTKHSKPYPWRPEEDIQQAFERILCSTMDEFKRQLAKSDRRGTWYDPAFMKRAYKTLPESVAVGLCAVRE